MLTFKLDDKKTSVLFFCGNNVLRVVEVRTIALVNPERIAKTFRDFGSLADRTTLVKIAKDYLTENNLI